MVEKTIKFDTKAIMPVFIGPMSRLDCPGIFMKISIVLNHILCALPQEGRPQNASRGSVLVYLTVVILIFGILGVTMVSLFTTATTSSATPNDARRAYNLAESGTRYAFSELRDNDFEVSTINDLNSTTYNVTDAGSFSIRAFSLWFESPSKQNGNPYTLNIPKGRLPLDSFVPVNGNVWLINFEYLETTDDLGSRSPISAYTRVDDTTATFNILGSINVSTGERVCLGVMPAITQGPLTTGADLYVERIAKDFFPRFNGAININRFDYSYERLVDEPANNRVKLENLTAFRFNNPTGDFPLTVTKTADSPYTGDFVALSPRNYKVIPTGTSGSVSYGGDYDFGMNIYDTAIPFPRPDIDADEFTSNLTENETSSSFISVDTDADTLNIGGGVTPGINAEFGAGWYDANKSIGGGNNICQAGACEFRRGIRVFFVLKFLNEQQGDGLTFTLMSAENNDLDSVGGDFELSELMGYAGNSRTADGGFLDPSDPRGIQPPKLAIELDTRTNFDEAFESAPEDFCINSSLKPNTRNDPLSNNRDAVQYVFWGDSSFGIANVRCRSSNPSTYDDNRHGTIEAPINDRTLGITSIDQLDSSVAVDDPDSWLNGSTSRGPWAIRIEIERENIIAGGRYTIQTWIRQCAADPGSPNCTDENIIGPPFDNTSFQSTRIKYDFSPVGVTRLSQTVELTEVDHNAFRSFFFGFTGAADSEALDAEISKFQLSFIRNDREVTNDPNWTP
jgi:hypothetical protein